MSRIINASGNQSIDGLLSGVAWSATNLVFTCPDSVSVYGAGYGNGETDSFQAANAAQRASVRYALQGLVESYTKLTFTEATGTAAPDADIRFALSGVPVSAYAYYPSGSVVDGDIWMNPNGGITYTTPAAGNWGLATILHELGHALGLKHGHESDGFNINPGPLPTTEDNWNYSLMTYRSYTGSPTNGNPGNSESDNPTTYMQDDIAALQYMYGANFSTNAGDTVYRWDPVTGTFFIDGQDMGAPANAKIFMTVWDGNGLDTYDLSNYATALSVDLRPGAFSTFNPDQVADLDGTDAVRPALGNVANARLYQGDTRSLIENAIGGSGSDHLVGNVAANLLVGNDGDDILDGLEGDDTLDGRSGADAMSGGSGNDRYVVENAQDSVTEKANEGIDTVSSWISYELGANVENLTLLGSAGLSAWGNALANVIEGNSGDNVIDGGAGADIMRGGQGNDRYIVDNPSDQVFEAAGGGLDTVIAFASFALSDASQVEVLEAAGRASLSLTGSSIANRIVGNLGANGLDGAAGDDTLNGGAGDDTLNGGTGRDMLTGDAGRDIFVFQTKPIAAELDVIADFSVADDTIWLDNAVFTKLGAGSLARPVKLSAKKFWTGTKAHDPDDRIIYNKKTGLLSYDPDGTGKQPAAKIAMMTKGLKLTAADFFVV